jgi:hypothetical protein
MFDIEQAIIVHITNDYDLVRDFLRFEMDENIPRFRGGYSGRGDHLAYFPIDQEEKIREFLSNYDPDFGLEDDF